MSDFNRHTFPSGGFQFYQPQTGWTAPAPISNTFDQQVVNIIKHRRANPAVVAKHNLSLDPVTVGNELEQYNRLRLGIPAPSPKPMPPPSLPQMSGAVQQAVAAVKKIAAGAAILLEWEQSGEPPVDKALAEKRAAICAGCPKNEKDKSLTEIFTVPAAERIRSRLQRLHSLGLTTSRDAELKTCQACLCPLPLKVHTPLHLIQKRLKPEQRAELDPRCWILANT